MPICTRCRGIGHREEPNEAGDGLVRIDCPVCEGTGELIRLTKAQKDAANEFVRFVELNFISKFSWTSARKDTLERIVLEMLGER